MGFPLVNDTDSVLLQKIGANSSSLTQAQVNEVSNYFWTLLSQDKHLKPYLLRIFPSGSFAKGTAIKGSSDIDLFLSFNHNTPYDLGEIYRYVHDLMAAAELNPRKQNVSIGVRLGVVSVDLVPGKLQNQWSKDHSLHIFRQDTWQKTNVEAQIAHVKNSQRHNVIKAFKIWKRDKKLPFPSFLVELTVIKALEGTNYFSLNQQCSAVIQYLKNKFESAQICDPGCPSNVVSADLQLTDKKKISSAAAKIINWSDFI